MLKRVSVAGGLFLALLAGSTQGIQAADAWGSIEGQFVADGKIEVPLRFKKGDPTVKDGAVCAVADMPDESLIVNPENNGIANVFIYLRKAPAKIHPDSKAPPKDKIVFDQVGCRYVPHALAVRVGQPVQCISSDAAAHNLHTNPVAGSASNFIVQPNDKTGQDVKFDVVETLPVKVVCDIHSWMDAYWVVTDHPYVAVTDKDGKFKIENLPAGEHSFRVWHERQGYLNREYKVKVEAGKTNTLKVEKVPVAKLAKK